LTSPSVSKYIAKAATTGQNHQKLLGYYGELYEFYNDKKPDNDYIYYLDENPYSEPAQTTNQDVLKFFSASPLQLGLLTPSIKIWKAFNTKTNKKRIEFPFENRMDFEGFKDPHAYIAQDSPFVTDRFMGPIVGLKDLSITYKGVGGKGADIATLHTILVDITLEFQDVKMLFKNLDDSENIKYKDIFAAPPKGEYGIVIELSYGVPENLNLDLEPLTKRKMILNLKPNAGKTNIAYRNDGSATVSTQMEGWAQSAGQTINLLDPKYYKSSRKSANMLVVENQEEYSTETLNKKRADYKELLANPKKGVVTSGKPTAATSTKSRLTQLKAEIKELERKAQLASSIKSVPPVFSFVTALYEAGLVYFLEMDNDQYKNYIKKIAQGEYVDVDNLKVVPKNRKKVKLSKQDAKAKVKPNSKSNQIIYNANGFKIGRFNVEEDETDSKLEKVKFFYFGDLLNIILNNTQGGGIGQDLDELGNAAFNVLLGPTVFIQNKKSKKIYNIANTPISLDMFLFELNKVVYGAQKKAMSFREFMGDFMKTFFDLQVLSGEKEKTGKDVQYYTGDQVYTLDEQTIDSDTKTIKNFAPHMGVSDTTNIKDFLLIKNVLYDKKISKASRKKLNIPTIFLGGPDKGPLKTISYRPMPITALATAAVINQYNLNKGNKESLGEAESDSVFITSQMAANLTLRGNPFININDTLAIDTRFVDGGFFQEKNNLLFFSGLFHIFAVDHRLRGNDWTTTYQMNQIGGLEPTKTYATTDNPLPKSQDVALAEEASNNQTGTAEKDKKAEKKAPDKKKKKGKKGGKKTKASKGQADAAAVTAKDPEVEKFNKAEGERHYGKDETFLEGKAASMKE